MHTEVLRDAIMHYLEFEGYNCTPHPNISYPYLVVGLDKGHAVIYTHAGGEVKKFLCTGGTTAIEFLDMEFADPNFFQQLTNFLDKDIISSNNLLLDS